ncbi:MAG: DUF4124 domain-containing protein [Betaproteobacteria bacterium]|nr:DUF4124 domain-containing protein [Betaproteobacteria bacterium]
MTRLLLLIGLASLPLAGWGQIYKWVDEKGVTHYTETPPPGGKGQVIRTQPRSPLPDAPNVNPAVKTWQEQEIEFRQRRVEAEETERKRQANASRDMALRRACAGARADLENLRMERPIVRIDERGERRYIEDKERAELIRRTEQIIQRDCPAN